MPRPFLPKRCEKFWGSGKERSVFADTVGVGILIKHSAAVIRAVALTFMATLPLVACGNATNGANTKVAPSVFDAPLGSDAVLVNGTGINPAAPSATAPTVAGCLSRATGINGNDINCSDEAKYSSLQSCQLNPYFGYANFLVKSCPTTNLIGHCTFATHTMYYYQGYLIVSPATPVSVLSAGCAADGGTWG